MRLSKHIICRFCQFTVSRMTFHRHLAEDCQKPPKTGATHKVCTHCQEVKLLGDFGNRSYDSGKVHTCKACAKTNYREWRANHPGYKQERDTSREMRPSRWVMRPCKYCAELFSWTGMKKHLRRCPLSTSKRYKIADDGAVPNEAAMKAASDASPICQVTARKSRMLKYCYGMDTAEYQRLFAAQNGVCAICGLPPNANGNTRIRNLHVDHCHTTGEVRSLLCYQCNHGIGSLKDSPELLDKAKAYLLHWRSVHAVAGHGVVES